LPFADVLATKDTGEDAEGFAGMVMDALSTWIARLTAALVACAAVLALVTA
jgi:hypothetical protein